MLKVKVIIFVRFSYIYCDSISFRPPISSPFLLSPSTLNACRRLHTGYDIDWTNFVSYLDDGDGGHLMYHPWCARFIKVVRVVIWFGRSLISWLFPCSSTSNFLRSPSFHISHMPSRINGIPPGRMLLFTLSILLCPRYYWLICLDFQMIALGFVSFCVWSRFTQVFIRSSCFLCLFFARCVLSST